MALTDELRNEMLSELAKPEMPSQPSRSTLDPQVRNSMLKDLGMEPATAIQTGEEEPGYVGSLVKGIGAGFRRRLPEMIGQAIQFGTSPLLEKGAVSPGEKLSKWATEGEKRPEFKNPVKEALYAGGEMLAPSVVPAIAMGPLGVGGTAASAITGGLFGLSQAQQTLDTAKERGVESGVAPFATGTIEALGEILGTLYLTKLLGPLAPLFTKGMKPVTAREVIKPTLKRMLTEMPKTLGVEVGTEMGQNLGEAAVEKYAGVRPEANPIAEALSAIGPTIVLTGITGGLGLPMSRVRGRAMEKALSDEKINPTVRSKVVNALAEVMGEADERIGASWKERALKDVAAGQPINLDQDIYEYLGMKEPPKPKEAAPKEAIPMGPVPEAPEEPGQPFDILQNQPAPKAEDEPSAPAEAPSGAIDLTTGEEQGVPAWTAAEMERQGLKPGRMLNEVDLGNKSVSEALANDPMIKRLAAIDPGLAKRAAAGNVTPDEIRAALAKEKPPGQPKEIKQAGTTRPTAIQEEKPKPKEIKTKGFFPAADWWNKKVGEVLDEWTGHLDNLNALGTELDQAGEPLRKQLDALKGKRDKESKRLRAEIEKQLQEHYGPIVGKQEEAEKGLEEEQNKFIEMVAADAVKRGVAKDKVDDFLAIYSDMAEPQRPALEWNYDKTHREVFEEALKEFQAGEQKAGIKEKIEGAAAEAATSSNNSLAEPTEAQKEAGNYQKGHISLYGLDISIENPKGSTRSGVSPEGRRWETKLAHHYGYIRGTKGKDKDHLDVFIGPNPESEKVFVVDQLNLQTKGLDEHKVMLGFNSLEEAREGYLANYESGWKGLGGITELTMHEFKDWIKNPVTKPLSPEMYKPTYEPKSGGPAKKTAIEQNTTGPNIREERNGKEIGYTLRNAAEDLMSGDPAKEEVTITMLVNAVRAGRLSKEDAMNVRNELMNIAYEEWVKAGKKEDEYVKYYQRTEHPAKLLTEAEKEMAAPGETQTSNPAGETKPAAIPEPAKRPWDEVFNDLLSGKITPREAQDETGMEMKEIFREFDKTLKEREAKKSGIQEGKPEEPKEIKQAGTGRPTGPKVEERPAEKVAFKVGDLVIKDGVEYRIVSVLPGNKYQAIDITDEARAPKRVILEESEIQPVSEEEGKTARPRFKVPYELVKFANALADKEKKSYAWDYIHFAAGMSTEYPEWFERLSSVAADNIRRSVDQMMERVYPDYEVPAAPQEKPEEPTKMKDQQLIEWLDRYRRPGFPKDLIISLLKNPEQPNRAFIIESIQKYLTKTAETYKEYKGKGPVVPEMQQVIDEFEVAQDLYLRFTEGKPAQGPEAPKEEKEEAPPEEPKDLIAAGTLPDTVKDEGQKAWKEWLNHLAGFNTPYKPGKVPLSTLNAARTWFMKLYDAGSKGIEAPQKAEGVKPSDRDMDAYKAGQKDYPKPAEPKEIKQAGTGRPTEPKEEKRQALEKEIEADARFVEASTEFAGLEGVNIEPATQKNIADLLQAARQGIESMDKGETAEDAETREKIEAFILKWSPEEKEEKEKRPLNPKELISTPGNHWLKNPETGKIELHFSKAEYDRLPENLRRQIKVRFLWAPSRKAWVSKATKDMFWPRVVVRDLTAAGIFKETEEKIQDKEKEKLPPAMDQDISELTEEKLDALLEETKAEEKVEPIRDVDILQAFDPKIVQKPNAADLGIQKKDPKMFRAKIHDRLVWSNGSFLDIGELPYKNVEGKIKDQEPTDATELWEDSIKKASTVLGEPWVYEPKGDLNKFDKVIWGGKFHVPIAVDLRYFNYFRTKYPGCDFVFSKEHRERATVVGTQDRYYPGVIVVRDGLSNVGLVMPMNNKGMKPEHIEEFRPAAAEGEKGAAPKAPREKKEAPTKPLADILRDVGDLGVKGVDEALKGLYDLFGGSSLKSFPAGFDQDTYAKAKVHFEASFNAFRDAGLGLKEFVAEMVRQLGEKVKPYLKHFIQEKMEAKQPAEEEEEETTEGTLEHTEKGERGARKKLTEQEKAERDQKKKEAEERKAKKEAMGEFKNVGYVYDPEKLREKVKDKPPKSAARIIIDQMAPANVWEIEFTEGASQGLVRMKDQVQKMFKSFREHLYDTHLTRSWGRGRRVLGIDTAIERFAQSGGQIDDIRKWAEEYGKTLQPFIDAFKGSVSIANTIASLQQLSYPGVGTQEFPWAERPSQIPAEKKNPLFRNFDSYGKYLASGTEVYLYRFLKSDWQKLLPDEHDTLLSEVNVNKRGKNKTVVRTGLPEYREGLELKKTEDFKDPFGFKGVGFGEEGWINQEERNRVIPAAYDAFKDLAATIGAPDKGMSLGGELAVQFANLGHKAKGSAASYFPDIKTINFTRDNGDGTMAHEWGHALHDLASPQAKDEINAIIKTLFHVFDFSAGERLANDLLSKDSQFLKRIIATKKQQRIEEVKKRIREEFQRAVKKETSYFKVSSEMNADYTARNQEMWARAWEAFIYDTLPGKNNYLVSDFVAAGRVGGKSGVGTMLVYPAGKEREQFNETIARFLEGLTWDENGRPTLKPEYSSIVKHQEALMKQKLEELLASVEERYAAIWSSEPSPDGRYWYRYDATEFGPMMQPEGYVAYDRDYKGTEPNLQNGTGAIGYLTQLHPDDILDFKLSNIIYTGENPVVITPEKGPQHGELQADGEGTLGETPSGPGQGPEEGGPVREQSGPGSIAGEPGTRGTYEPGRAGGSGEGNRPERIHPSAPGNFRIADDTLNDPRSLNLRFARNLAAIKLLKNLEEEKRQATPGEKEILSQYSGWGGFSELFADYPKEGWADRAQMVDQVLDHEEKSEAAASSPSAYYTPVPVGRFMWKLAQRLGFARGLVLEPSMGANGLFFGTMPDDLAQATQLQGVEKDGISARIAQKLYEKALIENKPFQEANKPNNRADLVIGNVPFQNFVVTDTKHNKGRYTLANYFVNKSLNLSAPGTVTMLITPTSVMDNPGDHLKEFSQKADLVGAIRLPSGIYAASDVVCDILVFRKKIQGSKFEGVPFESWGTAVKEASTGLEVNKYFLDRPDMVMGKFEKRGGEYRESLYVAGEGDLKANLERAAAAFPEKIVEREAVREIKTLDELIAAPGTVKEGGFYINDKGEVAIKSMGEEVKFPMATQSERKKAAIAKKFVGILDAVREVLRAQKSEQDRAVIAAAQQKLRTLYDAFFKAHGAINNRHNLEIYVDATDAPWVLALEEYSAEKDEVTRLADIFTKDIIPAMARPTHAETDLDALAMSLDEFGYPNPEYMAKLRGSDPDTVMKGVQDKVIENPETGFLETMDEYLSGNVKAKLAVAKSMAESNPQYERNVKLLEGALPEDIPAHRITVRIGASWIGPQHLSDYVGERMSLGNKLTTIFTFNPASNEWKMSFKGRETKWKDGERVEVKAETERAIREARRSLEATRMWGTPQRDFFLLIHDAIEGRRPLVTYYDPTDQKSHIDAVATRAAEAKLADIQGDFGRWLFSEPKRAEEAVRIFNEKINTSIPMKADGSHLTFPGKSLAMLTGKEAEKLGTATGALTMYPHQASAVWKYLKNGNVYLAHEVGTGKTATMAMIAMEARRLRGKKKVLYVTHSDTTFAQAIGEIKRLYPLANIMPVRVSTEEERKQRTLQKLAMNEFDVAVMRQQDIDRIALSPDAERAFIQEEVDELREILEEARANGTRILERDIQTRMAALEEKLKETVHEEAKRKNLYFDDLGIDLMIIDEAHRYKNVPYATRLTRITGLNPPGSPTARAMFRKTQYLNAQFPKGDAIVLASGTPLTNSIAELYNIQRMLQPKEVKRQGVWSFDRWIANFGDIGTSLEWDGARGEYRNITTNNRIVNAGRLLATAYQNVDSVRVEDTPVRRPEIRGGEPIRIKVQPNKYVKDYQEIVLERCRNLEQDPRHAEFEGVPDNMLRIISNMSKVAIDQRLDPRYANTEMQEDSKIFKASRIIFRRWQEEKDHKGVQLVFADLGVPHRFAGKFRELKPEQIEALSQEERAEYEAARYEKMNQSTGFNTYDALTAELVKLGIPRNEIAYIHDADSANKEKKSSNLEALYRKVNAGEIRVLIGSTSKAGTGVNIQERVSDVHHLDVWWNYSAWEQRNGRAIRAGNIYTDLEGVYIHNYATETTVDATRWDKIFAKGKVLNSVLAGDINLDVIEDISEETLSARLMAAEASGDPLMATHANLLHKVQALRMEQSGFLDNLRRSRGELSRIPGQIQDAEATIDRIKKSRAVMEQVTAVQFVGDDRTLVFEKHGKDIAEALDKFLMNPANALAKVKVPLLVFGSHTETTEIEKTPEGKEKKVKKYTFQPLPVQATILPHGYAFMTGTMHAEITGDINPTDWKLAELEFDKKKNLKGITPTANVSRAVTNYLSDLDRGEKSNEEYIEEKKGNEPKLKKIIETPWPKQEDFEESVKKLEEVERQMARRGIQAGNAKEGLPIARYEAPVPTLEDVTPKESWFIGEGVTWPAIEGRDTPPFAFSKEVTLKDFAANRAGKFEPQVAGRYNRPESNQVLSGPPLSDKPAAVPFAFTSVNDKSQFWLQDEKDRFYLVDPLHWELVNRIMGKAGTWHIEETGRIGGKFLIHETAGKRDAYIEIKRAGEPPSGVRELAKKAEKPKTGETSFSLEGMERNAPPFYSALRRTIDQKMGGAMPAKQLRALLKQPGIKQDEIKWSGLDDWLNGKEGKVTKIEVLRFLDENQLQVKEVLKGETGKQIEITPEQRKAIHDYLLESYPAGTIWLEQEEEEGTPVDAVIDAALEGDATMIGLLEQTVDSKLLKPIHEGEPLFEEGGRPKFQQWSTPGGQNYRELLFTLPAQSTTLEWKQVDKKTWVPTAPNEAYRIVQRGDNFYLQFPGYGEQSYASLDRAQKAAQMIYRGTQNPAYRGLHWTEPNVLAHVRFDDRTGTTKKLQKGMVTAEIEHPEEKVLFIQEIQSDWHQTGRERGYRPDFEKAAAEKEAEVQKTADAYKVFQKSMDDKYGTDRLHISMTPEELHQEAHLFEEYRKAREAVGEAEKKILEATPDAPFAKTWHEFVLKRMVRWAAENGYERIAWTTGKQQADRYKLSSIVQRIEWGKLETEISPEDEVTLSIMPIGGDQPAFYEDFGKRLGLHWEDDPDAGPLFFVKAKQLPEVIGKEMTQKILESKETEGSFEGDELVVGGHGMGGFYDKIIPEYLNKFGKKWGAKVEDIQIGFGENYEALGPNGEGLGQRNDQVETVHSLPITQEMKRTALQEGFPLFQNVAPKGWDKAGPGQKIEAREQIGGEELHTLGDLVNMMVGVRPIFQQTIPIDLKDERTRTAFQKHGYTIEEIEARIAMKDTAFYAAGSMTPVWVKEKEWKPLIKVALQGRSAALVRNTSFHEAYEAARKLMLNKEEIDILDARIPGGKGIAASENQADAFAQYVQGNRMAVIPKTAQTFFERIIQFFTRLRNWLHGQGFQTAEDVFERIARGETLRRYRKEGRPAKPETGLQIQELHKIENLLDKRIGETNEAIATDHKHSWDPYANVARLKVTEAVKKGLRIGKAPQDVFGPMKQKALEAFETSQAIKADSYDEVARLVEIEKLEKMVQKVWPFPGSPITTVLDLGEFGRNLRKFIAPLKNWDFAQAAETTEGFKDFVKKNRFGLVKVTDRDLKLWERILSLPFWLHFKYKELRPLVHTQMKREEARATTIHDLLVRGKDFFTLEGDQLGKLEKAIVQGDKDKAVYDEETLREVFKLNDAGVKAYRAARDTLNWVHKEWREKIEENFLREFERERWFTLFKAAHDFELSSDETTRLAGALKKTYAAYEKPVNTVRRHLQKIFREKLTQNDKRLLVKNYVEAWHVAKAQLLEIKQILKNTIGEGMSEEDLEKATKALVQSYIRTEPQATRLKEMRDELNRLKGYFPRSRKEGKYRVVIEAETEDEFGQKTQQTLYYENAANRFQATAIYNRLKKDERWKDYKPKVLPNRREAETTFMGASSFNLQRLVDNAITRLRDQGEVDPEGASKIRQNVLEVLADELKARGAGRYAIRRAGHIIEGYQTTNLKEVLKDYIDGWSGMMTKQDAALQFLEELKDIPKSKPQLMAYASKYAQDMLRNQERMDQVTQKARSLAFIYFLGGSLRAAAVNFTQNFVTAIPFYAREVGYKGLRAEKDYFRAMYEVATGKNLSAPEKKMLDEMINKGIAEDQYIRQITREVKGAAGKLWGKVIDLLAKPFSLMEVFNRKSAALTMFREKYARALKAGIDQAAAYERAFNDAQDFVYKTHYLMTKANLPSVAAGGDVGSQFLRTAYTFRRFTHNYLLSMQHSFRGPDGKAALDVIGRSLAYIAILGGIPALPLVDDLLDWWERMFGTPVRSSMRKTMRDLGGPVLEKMGMAGIPALIGVNISGSIKTQIPFVGQNVSDSIYGVYGGMWEKWMNAKDAWARDDALRAIEFASPSFLEAALKAYRTEEKGVTTPKGKVMTDEQGKPIRLTVPEAGAQAIGFRPERLAEISGEHRTMSNLRTYFNDQRDNLYARYRLARTAEERQGVIRDMQKFNLETRKYRRLIQAITATSLRQAALQRPEKSFMKFGRMMEASP